MKDIRDNVTVDRLSGCWNWNGAKDSNGYGMISIANKRYRTHRVSALVWLGVPLEERCVILHNCDNPKCCNPEHLTAGTQKDNMVDCASKGRIANMQKTHCKQGHPLEGENLYTFRRKNGSEMRVCRECRKTRIRLFMREKRHPILPPTSLG